MSSTPNVWEIADAAGVTSPDTHTSPGAVWLERTYAAAVECIAQADDPEDVAHEEADAAVPVYTHERWQVFVDLAAYREDLSEYGPTPDDLTEAAGVALYSIARRVYDFALSSAARGVCGSCGDEYDVADLTDMNERREGHGLPEYVCDACLTHPAGYEHVSGGAS